MSGAYAPVDARCPLGAARVLTRRERAERRAARMAELGDKPALEPIRKRKTYKEIEAEMKATRAARLAHRRKS